MQKRESDLAFFNRQEFVPFHFPVVDKADTSLCIGHYQVHYAFAVEFGNRDLDLEEIFDVGDLF